MTPSFHSRVGASMLKWVVASLATITAATTAIAYISNQVSILQAATIELKEFKAYQMKKDEAQDLLIKQNGDDVLIIRSDLKYIIKLLEKK